MVMKKRIFVYSDNISNVFKVIRYEVFWVASVDLFCEHHCILKEVHAVSKIIEHFRCLYGIAKIGIFCGHL